MPCYGVVIQTCGLPPSTVVVYLAISASVLFQETDWQVLSMVSQSLAKALQNRNLVLASNANLDLLCTTLCAMVSSLQPEPPGPQTDPICDPVHQSQE